MKKIQFLRLIALCEGLSWLALIGAMVAEHLTGHHSPVSWTGRIHGGLFSVFAITLLLTWIEERWSFQFVLCVGLSSLIPFGFLFIDPLLRKKLVIKNK